MKNSFVAILDFGSSKITCMAASKLSESGEFIIKAVGQSAYSGFDDNAFYEPDALADSIRQAVSQVETKMDCDVREIYVGVPGAFSAIITSEASTTFHSKKKIDADDVADVVAKADIYKCDQDFTPLGGKPVYYILDGAIKSYDPVGIIASKLTALVSFSYMKKYFRNCVAPILLEMGVSKVYYVNTCEAQANYVTNAMFREGYSIIIDVGYITTNVLLCGGKGLLFAKTFALGCGYLASDLCQVLGCDFNLAMSILEKVNLNLDIQSGDAYSVNGQMVDASQTNAIVKERIGQIAEYVIKSFRMCDKPIPASTPIILTGGGLAYIRGGVDCLANQLGKPVRLYDSVNPQTKRNEYTSCYGLIFEAVKSNTNKNVFLTFLKSLGIGKGDK